jgi:putative ABC transport system ATP-binding protein
MTNIKFILEVENLTVVYNENTPFEVVALKDFSMTVQKGEIVLISGGNGSGKSTLLRAISGAIPIKAGKIRINGKDISKWSADKRARFIATVHQDTMLGTCPNLTIQENFQLTNPRKWWSLTPYHLTLSNAQVESIKRTGLPLDARGTSQVNMLSGGQRQAVAVCLAFENNKSILLFDEFTSALDTTTAEKVLDLTFSKARENNSTLLMVMHNTQFIAYQNYKKVSL